MLATWRVLLCVALPVFANQELDHEIVVPVATLLVSFNNASVGTVLERSLNLASSEIAFRLEGDVWAEGIGADGAESDAFLGALVSRQEEPTGWNVWNGWTHEASGWNSIVASALSHSLIQRVTATQVVVRLPSFACFDLIASPELVQMSVPGVATASGRAPIAAPPMRIMVDREVWAPVWGSVRAPPIEEWRNCSHVQARWKPYRAWCMAYISHQLLIQAPCGTCALTMHGT